MSHFPNQLPELITMSHAHCHSAPAPSQSGTVSRALFLVGMVFIGFGLLEIILALVAGRSAATVFADGIDNLTIDGITLLGAAWIDRKLARVLGVTSEVSHQISKVVIGVMGPVLYGASLLAWSTHKATPISARETIILLAVGGASFWLNKRLHAGTSDHNHAGLSAHLINDMVAAVAIMLSTIVLALGMPISAGLTIFIGISAFNAMVWLSWRELRYDIKSLYDNVKKLAIDWLDASTAPSQTESAAKPPLRTITPQVRRDTPAPTESSVHNEVAIGRAVETAAAAIRNLTTLLFHDCETQVGLVNGDQDQPKVDCRLPASAVDTIIHELHDLREALAIHSPRLVKTSRGG